MRATRPVGRLVSDLLAEPNPNGLAVISSGARNLSFVGKPGEREIPHFADSVRNDESGVFQHPARAQIALGMTS